MAPPPPAITDPVLKPFPYLLSRSQRQGKYLVDRLTQPKLLAIACLDVGQCHGERVPVRLRLRQESHLLAIVGELVPARSAIKALVEADIGTRKDDVGVLRMYGDRVDGNIRERAGRTGHVGCRIVPGCAAVGRLEAVSRRGSGTKPPGRNLGKDGAGR